MRDETAIDMQEADEMHEAMDYMQHEKTWEGFARMIKWGIISLGVLVVVLYFIIQP